MKIVNASIIWKYESGNMEETSENVKVIAFE
jgi:hypothetical protein